MNIVIRDPETLDLLQPSDTEAYLQALKWKRVKLVPGEYASWEKTDEAGRTRKILVLLDREFADYAQRVSELLCVLAEVEKKSQLAVYDDISRIHLDGIAVRSAHPAAADGSIPVSEGARLVENAVELVEAAACSTVEAKPRFLTRRPKQANEYASLLRMGQTSRGSYIVNLYSPLRIPSDPAPDPRQIALPGFDEPTPPIVEGFGRKAVTTLARALNATKHAAEKGRGTTEAFQNAVQEGVSANLLSAVLGLLGGETPRVDVTIRWSPSISPPKSLPSSFAFERSHFNSIERAVEFFRQEAPDDEEVILRGHVIQLNRTSDLFEDRISLKTTINDRDARVGLFLANEDYRKAMRALEERKELQCRGRLLKIGRSHQYRLEEPKDVEIVS